MQNIQLLHSLMKKSSVFSYFSDFFDLMSRFFKSYLDKMQKLLYNIV